MSDVSIEVSHNETGTIRSVQFVSEDPGFEHYGKKGMKWGVRTRSKSEEKARAEKFGPKKPGLSPEAANLKKLKNRPASTLNNQQLGQLNKRMGLENTFDELVDKRSAGNKGLKSVQTGTKNAQIILSAVGVGTSMYALATSPAGKAAIANGQKILAKQKANKAAEVVAKTAARRATRGTFG